MSASPPAPPSKPSVASPTDKQICNYVAEMCAELIQIAHPPRFRTIRYLLDMARLESDRTGKELSD